VGVIVTESLQVDRVDDVVTLILSRPAQRNALDPEMVDALGQALRDYAADPQLRCAVITGAPPAFCAGLDLRAFSPPGAPRHLVSELIASIPECPKPLIAAVNGAAYTGGLEIALSCDFILAAEGARFADTHAKIGALSGSGMGARLPHAVGARFAKQMMLSCQPIDSATALRVGLVNEVVPDGALLVRAREVAAAIATHDSELVQIMKAVIDRGAASTLADALAIERDALARRKAERSMTWTP
jgi:enoyl-CoA hydratase